MIETLYKADVSEPSLVIGVVHGGEWDSLFGVSVARFLSALLDRKVKVPLAEVICCRSGPALSLGRGRLTNVFLEQTTADALLMLDADMWFDPALIQAHWQLFNQKMDDGNPIDVLGGLAFISSAPRNNQAGSIQPNIWADHPTIADQTISIWSYPQNSLIKVGATGAACLIVRRKVLEAIPVHHWHHVKILNYRLLAEKFASSSDAAEIEQILRTEMMDADEYGEDLSFCQRVKRAGYPIFMHTRLQYGHVKKNLLMEEDYIASQQSEADTRTESETQNA